MWTFTFDSWGHCTDKNYIYLYWWQWLWAPTGIDWWCYDYIVLFVRSITRPQRQRCSSLKTYIVFKLNLIPLQNIVFFSSRTVQHAVCVLSATKLWCYPSKTKTSVCKDYNPNWQIVAFSKTPDRYMNCLHAFEISTWKQSFQGFLLALALYIIC